MNEKLKEKTREALTSVLPITVIVLALSVTLVPMEVGTLALFLTGAVLLIVGMGFFQLGAEISMTPLGQGIGGSIVRQKKTWLAVVICFAMGAIITISEPDLQVLANQVAAIPNAVLIWTVAAGVGVFTAVAVLRILYRVPLSKMLLGLYLLLFVVSLFVPNEFLAVAFDAGGVTTGPMTVPFIMALGIGFSAARSDKDSANDSFGLIALCSVGPILMVMLLGIFYHPTETIYDAVQLAPVITTQDVALAFLQDLPHYTAEVLQSTLPIVGVFVLFQALTRSFQPRQLVRMVLGFVPHRCQRRVRARRQSAGQRPGQRPPALGAASYRHAHRLLHRQGRAGGAGAQRTGRGDHRWHHLPPCHEPRPAGRCGRGGGAGHAARADRT